MQKYQEKVVSGESWIRANNVHFTFPITAAPEVSFSEEEITIIDGKKRKDPKGQLRKYFQPTNADTVIPVLNPETNVQVGTMTYTELFAALYSLYIQMASERDAAVAAAQQSGA